MVDKYSRYGYGNSNGKKVNSKSLSLNEEYEIREAIQKLKQEKNKNIQLKKQNNELYNEILILKSNIRSQISIHQKSKGNNFPSFETLKNNINNFLNINCLNFFKNYLYEEYEIEGVVYFFKEIFKKCENKVKNHFISLEEKIEKKFKDINVKNTLDCVLINSFQVDWKRLLDNLVSEIDYREIMTEIQDALDINEKNERVNNEIIIFIIKTMELIFQCYINQPKIKFDINRLGIKVKFNENKYESFFGDISINEKSHIILPSFYYYNEIKKSDEKINKEKVMKQNFFEK
jgi:hypothetical protein